MIPAQAVEAAAKALWRRGRVDPWEDARDYITAEFREDALIALEAAAPYILSDLADSRDGDLFRFTWAQREWLRGGGE